MRILLTEQNPALAQIYKAKLEAQGFEVIHAGDHGQAELVFQELPLSLAIISVYSQHGAENSAGLRFLEKIRRHYYSPLAAIVLADYPENSQLQKALELAANAYIIKTEHSPDQIIQKIKIYV